MAENEESPDPEEDSGESQLEEMEVTCESCHNVGFGDDMVDCPRFEDDLEEKGVYPGWIHKSCCSEEFTNDPQGCIECCQETDLLCKNIEEHFEECIDIDGLVKDKSKNGVPVLTNEEKSFYITNRVEELLEPFKPLNVVTDTFTDEEGGIFYVKDHKNNLLSYSDELVKVVDEGLRAFNGWGCEQFCIPKGPLCIVYDVGDLAIGAMIAPRIGSDEIDLNKLGTEMATKYKDKYREAEEFFGVKIRTDRETLKQKIQSLSEEDFISVVLVPMLCAQGFKGVKPVSFHGPGESGGDFHPFYKIDEFGKIIYYSAQAKARKIHATAAKESGNVNQLINQVSELFRASFKSFNDNTERKITRAFIFSSQDIAPDARNQLFYAFENRQQVSLIEIEDIVTAILEKDLSEDILRYTPSDQCATK